MIEIALFLLALLAVALVGWKARRAHRSLWAHVELEWKRTADREAEERRQWQRCYGRLLAWRRGADRPIRLTAQHAEDVFLVDYFEDCEPGFFVEIGAYDGIQFSNTYALEQLGWTGLLVEAHPENARRCRANRPRSVVEHLAIGKPDAGGMVTFQMVAGPGADMLSALSPDEDHLDRCRREGQGIWPEEVPCLGLGRLLQLHPLPRIDLLSIDIEGGEIDALRGLDFDKLRPRLILLEANSGAAREALQAFLHPLSYRELKRFGVNVLFEDQRASSRPATKGFSCA